MILDDIVKAKRWELDDLKRMRPVGKLTEQIRDLPPCRDFAGAIGGPGRAVIAEIKRRSPSRGLLVQDFDPAAIAARYEEHGAAAISVLTEREFFGGGPGHLAEVRNTVDLPILRKDFIIDAYQITEARAIGADAVLLIAAVLAEHQLAEYIAAAAALGLAALVEVHTAEELDRAVAAGAQLIGINNRNLKTFVTDLRVCLDLAPRVPAGRTVVGESGIATAEDVAVLARAGIRAYLVGEVLMRADDVGAKLRELKG